MKTPLTPEEKNACDIVENLLRSLGGRCVQVSVHIGCVDIASVEWPGESSGKTLALALTDALNHDA